MTYPYIKFKRLLFALLVAASVTATSFADHLPDSKLARGKDDVVLAGVEVYKTPLDKIVSKFGRPDQQREGVVGLYVWKKRIWKKRNITIQVETTLEGLRETPYCIVVDGTDGAIGSTGRGLKLGDPYSAIAAVYGSRYVKQRRQVRIEWKTTTKLIIGWNGQGLINHIELFGAE